MPRDHQRKLIYIHIPKNAGKYVEDRYGLSAFPGSGGNQPGRSFWGKLGRVCYRLDWKSQSLAVQRLAGVLDMALCASHLSLAEMQLLGFIPTRLDDFSILVTVRNPYTRLKSLYYNHCHDSRFLPLTQENFECFAEIWPITPEALALTKYEKDAWKHHRLVFRRKQADFIRTVDGDIPSNLFIARVENIEHDLLSFENSSGLSSARHLSSNYYQHLAPHTSRGSRMHSKKPDLIISERVKQAVRMHYEVDFQVFGYAM